jgi:hypothetical protein
MHTVASFLMFPADWLRPWILVSVKPVTAEGAAHVECRSRTFPLLQFLSSGLTQRSAAAISLAVERWDWVPGIVAINILPVRFLQKSEAAPVVSSAKLLSSGEPSLLFRRVRQVEAAVLEA